MYSFLFIYVFFLLKVIVCTIKEEGGFSTIQCSFASEQRQTYDTILLLNVWFYLKFHIYEGI